MGISRSYLIKGLDEIVVRGYYDYMVEAAVLLGANRERAVREMRDVLNFEIAVANVNRFVYKYCLFDYEYIYI